MVMWLDEEDTFDEVDETMFQAEEDTLTRFLAERADLQKRVIGFAWKYVQCEPRHLPLFRKLLRGIVVAQDIDAAWELFAWIMPLSASSSGDLPFEMIVTVKGEVLHVSNWLTGGSGKESNAQGLLAYERELRELPLQLNEHISLIDQLNSRISEAQSIQEGRRIEQSAIDKELQKVVARINELQKVVNSTQRDLERLQTELQLAASLEQQLAAEIVGLEQEVQAAQERVRTHEKSQREMTGLVEELQNEMEERAIVYRRQQDELGRARTALAVKRQEAKDLKAQVEQHVARMKEAEQHQRVLQEAIALHREELEQVHKQAHVLANELHTVEEQANDVDRQLVVLEQQVTQVRHTLTERENAYRRYLLDSQKARDAVDSLLEQLREEMGMSDPKELSSYVARADEGAEANDAHSVPSDADALSEAEEAQLRKLRRRVDGLRGRLKALGGRRLIATKKYQELRTRFDFLSTQVKDM